MANSPNLKSLSLDNIKIKIKNFVKKISGNYLCIEFGYDYIQIAEAFYSNNSIGYKNVLKKELPTEAVEKGIPTDTEVMGQLIKNILDEENINLKRTAITLSPESIYSRLIEIPNTVPENRVVKYLLDPSSLIQIPISLEQTDFNIFKTSYQLSSTNENTTYFFIAVPKTSINNLIKTCENANLELFYVESGSNSILRLINLKAIKAEHKKDNFFILLELLSNCTQLTLADEFGPIYTSRLTSIRDYSISENNEISSESKDKYLPISNLDLKKLINEVKRDINTFFYNKKGNYNFTILLAGKNSSHPKITKVFSESIKLPTYLISPSGSRHISEVKLKDDKLIQSNFTKLFGLGLGLLDKNTNSLSLKNAKETFSILDFIEYEIPNESRDLLEKKSSKTNNFQRNKDINLNEKINNIDSNKKELNNFKIGNNKVKKELETRKSQLYDTNQNKKDNKDLKEKEEPDNSKKNEETQIKSEFKYDIDFLDID